MAKEKEKRVDVKVGEGDDQKTVQIVLKKPSSKKIGRAHV